MRVFCRGAGESHNKSCTWTGFDGKHEIDEIFICFLECITVVLYVFNVHLNLIVWNRCPLRSHSLPHKYP